MARLLRLRKIVRARRHPSPRANRRVVRERCTSTTFPMSSLLRLAARRAPRALPTGRRGYAEVSDKIKLSLVLPHQVRCTCSCDVDIYLRLNSSTTPLDPSTCAFPVYRPSLRRRRPCRSTLRLHPVTWVSLRTTSRPLSLSVRALWRSLSPETPRRSGSVRDSPSPV